MTKVCVISGAAAGIGRATLRLFCSRGYACLGIDRDGEANQRLLGELDDAARRRVRLLEIDLVAQDHVDISPIKELGGEEIELTLVNNLGGSGPRRPGEFGTWEEFAEVLAFNLKPTLTLTRACLGAMRDNGYGRIVNVASVAARKPLRTLDPAYGAAKAALLALSRQLAVELAADGILVNAVCPGIVATKRIEQRWTTRSDDVNREIASDIALGRLARPEEVAEAVFFLGSTSTYATGSILDVNGGMYAP